MKSLIRPVILALLLAPQPARGDTFTYLDDDAAEMTVEARLLGSGRGFQALERRDGQIQLVSNGSVRSRIPGEDPEPIDVDAMADLLTRRFGSDLVRIEIQRPFVIGLVLSAPLERSGEGRASALVKKSARFMKNVDSVFLKYARSMRFPLREARYPLVLLIFESDEDFNEYAAEATGGRGLSASAILGFYSGLTNWLAVRMSACETFEVPLHEAIHQQMYNRVFQRLAPVPKWFDEGIATGFEGSGERISVHPAKINSRYARQALRLSGAVNWGTVIADDGAFTADVLAGEAYTLAWCMHWMLATQHKEAYQNYVQELSRRQPLEVLEQRERVERFEEAFGASVGEVQAEFPRELRFGMKRQKIDLSDRETPRPLRQQGLGEARIQAVQRADGGGRVQVEGTIRNASPLRNLAFYVTAETETGLYADWLVSDLKPGQTQKLERQFAAKVAPGGPGGPSGSFRIWIRSSPAESPEAAAWKAGNVPGPVSGKTR